MKRSLTFLLALLFCVGTMAQSPFYVAGHWQYGENAQPNCISELQCNITFPGTSTQPYVIIHSYAYAPQHLIYDDGKGRHGTLSVTNAVRNGSDSEPTWTFYGVGGTIYNPNGSIAGTMNNEAYSITIENVSSRWGYLHVPRIANLQ